MAQGDKGEKQAGRQANIAALCEGPRRQLRRPDCDPSHSQQNRERVSGASQGSTSPPELNLVG